MIEFRLLGSVDLKGPDGTLRSVLAQPKRVALLAYLAVATPNGFHRRDKLLGLFWPESDQERGRGALRKALYFLRQSLGEEVIVSRGDEEIGLADGTVWCDAVAFEEALERNEPEEALELYRGDLLEGFFIAEAPEFERWLESERERLRGRASEAAWTLAEQDEEDGNGTRAASWAKKAVSYSPDEEGGFRRLLELLDRVGDRAGAMKEYEAFARRLNEEYEGEPSPETQALIAAIRERDTAAQGAVKAVERSGAEVPAEQATVPPTPPPRPTGLKGLIAEVHRRLLWQILLIYTGGALVAYQAVQALTVGLGLPDWFPGTAVVLFIVLLPVVLATAFVQEGGPPLTRQKPAPFAQAAAPAADGGPRARGVLTWRNSIAGGVLAFVLLGVAVSGYMGTRVMGIGPWGTLIGKGVLEERDLIVLAEFEDHTNDSLALALTDLVRVDLEQSTAVSVADENYVGRVLERMERDPDTSLTSDLAREVAIREGFKAVVTGEIHQVGSSYVLSLTIVAAETDQTLASFQETASGLDATIPAIERMSSKLRERIGESLKTVRSSPPLSQARTASLEALRLQTEAYRANGRGAYDRALDLLNRAIEIDTLFAEAYHLRSTVFSNRGGSEWAQWIADATRAYELRHRLPLWERYWVEVRYHAMVRGDREKRISALRALLELRPDHAEAVNALGLFYRGLRDFPRAEEMFRRRLQMDSLAGTPWHNLTRTLFDQGKLDEVEETLRQWEAKLPEHPDIPLFRARFASAQGDYEAARGYLRSWRDLPSERLLRSESLLRQAGFNLHMARLAQVQGKLADADSYFRHAMGAYEERGLANSYLLTGIDLAGLRVWFLGDTARALETMAAALERHPLDLIEPLERPYPALAGFYAFAGAPESARELLVEWETVVPPDRRRTLESLRRLEWGVVALAEGRADDAVTEFRFARRRGLPLLGRAYELAGQADSALAVYERYLTTPYLRRTLALEGRGPSGASDGRDPYWLPEVYERLGDLYEQRADTAKAVYYYGKLVDLWKDADPELQPTVEAARRAIEALSPDR